MNVRKLMEILSDMPGDAIITIGEDYDMEARVVTLLRIISGGNCDKVKTTVNIDK